MIQKLGLSFQRLSFFFLFFPFFSFFLSLCVNSELQSMNGFLIPQAVYLTGESLFKKELSPYAQLCYDRAARLHWNLQTPQVLSSEDETVSNEKDEKKSSGQEDVILHKEFSGIHFLTNGYDYWFSNQVDLKRACVVTLLDYFNCLVDGVSFRKLSYVEVLERKSNGEEEEEENWRKVLQRLSTWKQVSKGHPSFMSSTELFPALSGSFFLLFYSGFFVF